MPARCNSPDGLNFAQLRLSKRKEKEHERDAETEKLIEVRLERSSMSNGDARETEEQREVRPERRSMSDVMH